MADYKANRAGMRELLKDSSLYSGLEPHAQKIESAAKGNAPVATGHFRESIHTERHRGPSRVTMRVVSDDDAAVIIERTSNALGRAAG